jgi:hypothetical protein
MNREQPHLGEDGESFAQGGAAHRELASQLPFRWQRGSRLEASGEDAPAQPGNDGIDSGWRVGHDPASRTDAHPGHALLV